MPGALLHLSRRSAVAGFIASARTPEEGEHSRCTRIARFRVVTAGWNSPSPQASRRSSPQRGSRTTPSGAPRVGRRPETLERRGDRASITPPSAQCAEGRRSSRSPRATIAPSTAAPASTRFARRRPLQPDCRAPRRIVRGAPKRPQGAGSCSRLPRFSCGRHAAGRRVPRPGPTPAKGTERHGSVDRPRDGRYLASVVE